MEMCVRRCVPRALRDRMVQGGRHGCRGRARAAWPVVPPARHSLTAAVQTVRTGHGKGGERSPPSHPRRSCRNRCRRLKSSPLWTVSQLTCSYCASMARCLIANRERDVQATTHGSGLVDARKARAFDRPRRRPPLRRPWPGSFAMGLKERKARAPPRQDRNWQVRRV